MKAIVELVTRHKFASTTMAHHCPTWSNTQKFWHLSDELLEDGQTSFRAAWNNAVMLYKESKQHLDSTIKSNTGPTSSYRVDMPSRGSSVTLNEPSSVGIVRPVAAKQTREGSQKSTLPNAGLLSSEWYIRRQVRTSARRSGYVRRWVP